MNKKFPMQQCQDETLTYKFRNLHEELVNRVISFCNENNISIDEFHLNADCLNESIKYKSWQSCTDSCLSFDKFTEDYKDAVSMKRIVSNEEFEKIKMKQKPFLFSM